MKKIVFLSLILTALIVAISPGPAYACSCARAPPLESLEESAAVFSGKVIDVEGVPPPGPVYELTPNPVVKVTIQVSKVWKGPSDETLVIRSGLDGAFCGIGRTFLIGEEYLVYAYASQEGSELWTGLCTRTTQLSNAQEDLAALDMPVLYIISNYRYLILGTVGLVIIAIIVTKRWSSR